MSRQDLLYIYCIAQIGRDQAFEVNGLGDRGLVEGATGLRAVRYEHIAAVVSDIATREPEPNRESTLAHEAVVDGVMGSYPILPVRFGTVADGAQEIREKLLRRRYGEFLGLLREMSGKVELGLKVFWRDMGAVFKEIVAEERAVGEMRDKLASRQRLTQAEAVHLGKLVEAALDAKRQREAGQILGVLSDLADEVSLNGILLDQMVLNAAFLVAIDREADFDQKVAALDAHLGERLRLKYVGPMAPFNFVNIIVHWEE